MITSCDLGSGGLTGSNVTRSTSQVYIEQLWHFIYTKNREPTMTRTQTTRSIHSYSGHCIDDTPEAPVLAWGTNPRVERLA